MLPALVAPNSRHWKVFIPTRPFLFSHILIYSVYSSSSNCKKDVQINLHILYFKEVDIQQVFYLHLHIFLSSYHYIQSYLLMRDLKGFPTQLELISYKITLFLVDKANRVKITPCSSFSIVYRNF